MLQKFYGPVMCQNRPNVGNIIPINYQITARLFHILQHMAFWQFFYYCPSSIQRERSLKCECHEFDIYKLISIHIYIYRYHPLDKRHGFSIWVQPEFTTLLRLIFLNVKKKYFSKLAGLWLVGEVVNHVGLYGSKVAEGCSAFQRRSCV